MFNVRLWEFPSLGNFKGWDCAPLAGYASKRDTWSPLDTLSLSKPSTSDNLKLAVATIYLYFPIMYNNSEWEFLQDALMTLLELTAYFYFQQEEWRPFIETFPFSAIDEDTSRWWIGHLIKRRFWGLLWFWWWQISRIRWIHNFFLQVLVGFSREEYNVFVSWILYLLQIWKVFECTFYYQ